MPGGLHAPLAVKQSWPVPNYENPQLRPNTIVILAYVLGPLTVCLSLVRLWVRIFHQKSAGLDDWLMLAALPPTIVLTVLYPLADKKAFNVHAWDLDIYTDTQRLVVARKYILANEVIFCAASGLIKVSVLLFYRRLSVRVVSRVFFWTTWITIGYITAYSIALSIAPIVGCQPISAFWNQFDPIKVLQGYKFHCFDEGADVFIASIISASQDLLTAILPTFLYWNLRIPLRQKAALFGIFAIGYGVVALGVLRAYFSWYAFYQTYDVTWATWDILLTSLLELHIGCLCANAPALKVFFKHFFHEKLTSSKSRTRTPIESDGSRQSGTSIWSKLTMALGSDSQSGTRSTKGYHDSHSGVTVDPHGGVYVQKEIQVQRSPTSIPDSPIERPASALTTDNMVDHYYDDIELGLYTTRNSGVSSVHSQNNSEDNASAVPPPLPTSPLPPAAPATEPLQAHPILPSPSESPKTLQPIAPIAQPGTASVQDAATRAPTPLPTRTPSQYRPSWQNWS